MAGCYILPALHARYEKLIKEWRDNGTLDIGHCMAFGPNLVAVKTFNQHGKSAYTQDLSHLIKHQQLAIKGSGMDADMVRNRTFMRAVPQELKAVIIIKADYACSDHHHIAHSKAL